MAYVLQLRLETKLYSSCIVSAGVGYRVQLSIQLRHSHGLAAGWAMTRPIYQCSKLIQKAHSHLVFGTKQNHPTSPVSI